MRTGDRGSIHYAGLYEDGNWKCDCNPRRQAAFRQVKKDGRNKGRFFYSCATGKCNLFLWEDDARLREGDARSALARSRTLKASNVATTGGIPEQALKQSSMNMPPVASARADSTAGLSISSDKTVDDNDKKLLCVAADKREISIRNEWAHVLTQTGPRLEELEAENTRLLSRREELSENIQRLRDQIAGEEEKFLSLKSRRRDLERLVNSRR
ncbi:uncharacterized protein V1513DRAFT_454461 [Lipomyces chichibuensis]|uniref:uncharacterized protein n=1 Tax=Lipomyces chichibuensis TaxID=1546026 RepID=UPI003343405D